MNTTALLQRYHSIIGSEGLIAFSPNPDAGNNLSRRIKNNLLTPQSSQIIGWPTFTRMRIIGVDV
jgi:hypothetical protein